MNREIKFRAWSTIWKNMCYYDPFVACGWSITARCKTMYEEFAPIDKPGEEEYYKLMQYTGFKDKNGKEVYEGDYLDGYDFPIFYENGCFWISTMPDLYTCPLYEIDFSIAEVVGNKFENPRPDQ